MKLVFYGVSAVFIACLSAVGLMAEVRVPTLIGDHMVIQRDQPVHIWGNADPNESISISFRGESANTRPDEYGRWSVYLPPVSAGGPYELEIRGTNTIVIKDVLVGDVWLASGQSNMGFNVARVNHAQEELAAANHPRIRLFHVQQKVSDYPLDDAPGASWEVCSPETVKDFSAVAYFFGRAIEEDQKVPIGLVHSAFGGSAEAWISLQALDRDASLMPLFDVRAKLAEDETALVLRDTIWQHLSDEAKAEGKPVPPPPPPRAPFGLFGPGNLFNAMIAPLTPMRIRGVIWYQGESSSDPVRAPYYERCLQTLIADWRAHWGEGDIPFVVVQLPNFGGGDPNAWALVRNAQLRSVSIRNVGVAVTNDLGNPGTTDDAVHPHNKQDVGTRVALVARAIAYGEPVKYSGPLFTTATLIQNRVRLTFDHTDGGLVLRDHRPNDFEIAGSDGVFVPAEVTVESNELFLSNAYLTAPVKVRYGGYHGLPGTLFNGNGLPAAAFLADITH
jgi:sialate O-acetylesterase